MSTSTAPLREGLRNGDQYAWHRFVREESPGMYRYARSLLGDPGDAQDAVQQAFIRLHRSRKSLAEAGELRTLAFRVLTNLARDVKRDRQLRREREAQAAESAMTANPSNELAAAAFEAASALPHDLREVVLLRFAQGFTATETAHALGIPEGTVKTRQRTALERLRETLLAGGLATVPAPVDLETALQAGAARQEVPENVLRTMEAAIMASIGTKTGGNIALMLALLAVLVAGGGLVAWKMLEPPAAGDTRPIALAQDNQPANSRKSGAAGNTQAAGNRANRGNQAAGTAAGNNGNSVSAGAGSVPAADERELRIEGMVVDQDRKPVAGARVVVAKVGPEKPVGFRFGMLGSFGVGTPEVGAIGPFALPASGIDAPPIDAAECIPLARAPESTVTDATGKFVLVAAVKKDAAGSLVPLVASKSGYVSGKDAAMPLRAGHKPLLVMESLGRYVVFSTDPPLNEELPGYITVLAGSSRWGGGMTTELDEQGRHTVNLNKAEESPVQLRMRHPRFRPVEIAVPSGNGCTDLGTIKLAAGRRVGGQVVDASGKPLAGAMVRLRETPDHKGASETSLYLACNELGRFEFTVAPGDPADLVARAPGLAECRVKVEAAAADQTDLRLVLHKGSTVTCTVHDGSGATLVQGVGAMLFYAADAENPELTRYAGYGPEPSATGEIRFERVAPGSYVLIASHEKGSARVSVLVADEPMVVRLNLGGTSISGLVTGPDGKPMADASVFLGTPELRHVKSGKTDSEGRYLFEGIEPGSYVVLIKNFDTPSPALKSKRRVEVAAGQAATLDIDYSQRAPGNVFKGCITCPDLKIKGVFLMGTGASDAMHRGNVDEQGCFEISGIAPGDYYAWIMPRGSSGAVRHEVRFSGWDGVEVLERTLVCDELAVTIKGEGLDLKTVRLNVLPVLEYPFGPDPLEPMMEPRRLEGEGSTQVFKGMPRGKYALVATAPGRATVGITVDTARDRAVTLALEPGGSLLKVTLKGMPASMFENAEARKPQLVMMARLFAAGSNIALASQPQLLRKDAQLVFEGLSTGRYRVEVGGPLLVPTVAEVEVSGNQASLEMPVTPAARAVLVVEGLPRAELESASVRVFGADGVEYRPHGRLAALLEGKGEPSPDGREIGPLPAGTWRIVVDVMGHEPLSGEITLKEGERAKLELR